MKILFCTGKGGSGKTTSAVLAAMALRASGRCAAVQDLDPQGTATRWLRDDHPEMLDWRSAEVCLTDSAPRLDAPELRRAAHEADRIVVVSRPSPLDAFAGQDTARLLARWGVQGKARLLFTNLRPGTVLSRDLDQTADQIGLERLFASYQMREGYQHVVLTGWASLRAEVRAEASHVARALVGTRW